MARTSILSRKSVDSWISSLDLVFEDECRTAWDLIDLVDAVLKNHRGPIRKFKFVTTDLFYVCNEAIARWLIILSKNGIKDLELLRVNDDMRWNIPIWDIPGKLISSMSLERLSLAGCEIDPRPYFKGLKMVRTLILSEFGLDGTDIEDIFSSCPLLDHLELSDFPHHGCLRICTPILTFLRIVNIFDDIVLETPKLALGCIHLVERGYGDLRVNKEIDVIRALGHFQAFKS